MTRFRKLNRWFSGVALLIVTALATIIYVPVVLAFPYRAQFGEITVYSAAPIDPGMQDILDRAARLDATSPLAAPLGPRTIYLTSGDWRWTLLSLPNSYGAFAVTRPFSSNIVLNRTETDEDSVHNNAPLANRRSLSGTIAHETTHLYINRRYGLSARTFENWKVEGYCDFVARESSLTDADAAQIRASGRTSPALTYYDARRKVAAELASGKSVDQLFGK